MPETEKRTISQVGFTERMRRAPAQAEAAHIARSGLKHRIRYLLDADYRISCIADEVTRRLDQRLVDAAADQVNKRVSAVMEACFGD